MPYHRLLQIAVYSKTAGRRTAWRPGLRLSAFSRLKTLPDTNIFYASLDIHMSASPCCICRSTRSSQVATIVSFRAGTPDKTASNQSSAIGNHFVHLDARHWSCASW